MSFLTNKINQELLNALEANSIPDEFKSSIKFRNIFIGLLVGSLIITIGIPFFNVILGENLTIVYAYIFVPGFILLPIIFFVLLTLLKLDNSVRCTENNIIILSKGKIKTLSYDEINEINHHLFSSSISLKCSSGEYFISKYLVGFEFLLEILLRKTGISSIKLGEKTRISQNYFVVTSITAIGLSSFVSYLILTNDEIDIEFILIFIPTSSIFFWLLSLLLALEAYCKYQFYEEHFFMYKPLKKHKIEYQLITDIALNKGQHIIHIKYKNKELKLYIPFGISLEEMFIFLKGKTNITTKEE